MEELVKCGKLHMLFEFISNNFYNYVYVGDTDSALLKFRSIYKMIEVTKSLIAKDE